MLKTDKISANKNNKLALTKRGNIYIYIYITQLNLACFEHKLTYFSFRNKTYYLKSKSILLCTAKQDKNIKKMYAV